MIRPLGMQTGVGDQLGDDEQDVLGGGPLIGGGGGQTQQPPTESKSQGLTQSQAEQILNSMDRRERETKAEQQRRLQTGSAGGVKDW